jgi:peptidyl-prolyl cis-trans isomerase D
VTQNKLTVTTSPLITATGAARADASYKFPPEFAPALKAAFDIAPTDEPEVVATADKSGYVMVSPQQVVAAAPAPLASIRDQVAGEWIMGEGLARAKKAADTIAAKGSQGTSLADAIKQLGVTLPVQPLKARRLQVAQANPDLVPALRTLFSLQAGKAKMVPDAQRRGFFVVKVDKVLPANSLAALPLVGRMKAEIEQQVSDDYARQFVSAIRADLKVRRNEDAIEAMKKRFAAQGG